MGRLENFIPMFQKVRFEVHEEKAFVAMDGQMPLPVDGDLLPFLGKINGHLSLREIFLFLNKKEEPIRVEKSLETLLELAKRKFLTNGEEYIKLYTGAGQSVATRHNPQLNNLSHGYFSHERLVVLLQKTTLFLKCHRDTAEQILKHASLENVQENIKVIREGTRDHHFFILLAGEVGVYRMGRCLANLTPLAVFGESAAVFNQARNADVITTSPCWLLKIDVSQLVDTEDQDTFEAFNGLKSRLILNQTLSANPLFKNVPSDILQLFISKCRLEKHSKEQTIIQQGDTSGDFYFILKGSVSVIKDGMPMTSLGEGEHFGEVAAVFHEPRTASVVTETECVFLALNHSALFDVLCSHFRLAIDIEKTAEDRKKSESDVMSLFEDTVVPTDKTKTFDELSSISHKMEVDDEFLEITQTNFDMEVLDFSLVSIEDDDEAAS
ncbi:MAG: cyclic nucleotide-binding domain-containing protein [Bdellovibrionales bacterium]|nr:cyclic nucleotide-binding domain-containing protein [Bdellovibrionales bacterium]